MPPPWHRKVRYSTGSSRKVYSLRGVGRSNVVVGSRFGMPVSGQGMACQCAGVHLGFPVLQPTIGSYVSYRYKLQVTSNKYR